MDVTLWYVFALAYIGITLSPGPNVLNVIVNATQYGFKSIYITIAGNLVCQLLIIIAVGLGVGALLVAHPALYWSMKWIGASYLVYLGCKGLYDLYTGKRKQLLISKTVQVPLVPSIRKRFISSFLISASNPKTVIFLSAFLPQFLVPTLSMLTQFAVMYLTIAIIVISIHSVYAVLALKVSHSKLLTSSSGFFASLSSVIFIALGLKLGLST